MLDIWENVLLDIRENVEWPHFFGPPCRMKKLWNALCMCDVVQGGNLTRLQCVKAAVVNQLKQLRDEHPTRKVALITFDSSVSCINCYLIPSRLPVLPTRTSWGVRLEPVKCCPPKIALDFGWHKPALRNVVYFGGGFGFFESMMIYSKVATGLLHYILVYVGFFNIISRSVVLCVLLQPLNPSQYFALYVRVLLAACWQWWCLSCRCRYLAMGQVKLRLSVSAVF